MGRLSRLLRGFLGLFISGLEERNPEALMEAARQEFRNKMAQYNLALAQMAGVAERLKNQIKGKNIKSGIKQAAAVIRTVARPMSMNAYKVDIAQNMVERTILQALG